MLPAEAQSQLETPTIFRLAQKEYGHPWLPLRLRLSTLPVSGALQRKKLLRCIRKEETWKNKQIFLDTAIERSLKFICLQWQFIM